MKFDTNMQWKKGAYNDALNTLFLSVFRHSHVLQALVGRLVIFHCNLVIFQSLYLNKIGCLFSNVSYFQPFFEDLLCELLLEDLHQQNE